MTIKRQSIPKAIEHQVREQCGQACANPACRKWNTAAHELHHIDGDRSRSILDNLILLCANCHSEEQQGIISLSQIVTWKKRAESGSLPPPSIVVAEAAKEDRRRVEKAKIRDWIDEVTAAHPLHLPQTHKSVSAQLRSMSNLLVDDLRPENRQCFARACVSFLEATAEEIRPTVTPSPMTGCRSKEDQEREAENWRKPGKLLIARLTEILNCI